jgi:hypothetical protein
VLKQLRNGSTLEEVGQLQRMEQPTDRILELKDSRDDQHHGGRGREGFGDAGDFEGRGGIDCNPSKCLHLFTPSQ